MFANYDINAAIDMKMKMKIKEMFMTMKGVTVTKMETDDEASGDQSNKKW